MIVGPLRIKLVMVSRKEFLVSNSDNFLNSDGFFADDLKI